MTDVCQGFCLSRMLIGMLCLHVLKRVYVSSVHCDCQFLEKTRAFSTYTRIFACACACVVSVHRDGPSA